MSRILAGTLAVLVVLADAGCEQELPPPEATYTVRGMLRHVPGPNEDYQDLVIHHERIDDFVGRDGEVAGMKAMTMSFTPADELALQGLSPGDKVEFTFEVRWEASPTLRVTEIEPLPADAELDLGGDSPK